jgi:hypothetical protein
MTKRLTDHYEQYLDFHLQRVKEAMAAAALGRYGSAKFLSQWVNCVRSTVDFYREFPVPWDDLVPPIRVDVPQGAAQGTGFVVVPALDVGYTLLPVQPPGTWNGVTCNVASTPGPDDLLLVATVTLPGGVPRPAGNLDRCFVQATDGPHTVNIAELAVRFL